MEDVEAISFDGDGTLWDFDAVMRRSLALTLAELRRRLPGPGSANLTVEQMIGIRNRVADELRGEGATYEEIRRRAFERTVVRAAGSDRRLAQALYALYMRHRFADVELYPDVIPALDALPSGLTVGFLSNGNSYPDRCGLGERFDFVILAKEVGVEKPDAEIFRFVCQVAGCSPGELVHVGDSLEEDVAGANGAGAVSVWINRTGKENDSGIVPEYEIQSLQQLADMVARGEEGADRMSGVIDRRR